MRYHSYSGGHGLPEEKLAEGEIKIAGLAEADAELDLRQLECVITQTLKLLPDVGLCDQAFGVQLNVQEFFPRPQVVHGVCAIRAVSEKAECHRSKVILAGLN